MYCDAFVTDQMKLEMKAPRNAAIKHPGNGWACSRARHGCSGRHVVLRDILQREGNARRHTPGENRGRKESNSGDADNNKTKLLTLLSSESEQVHQVAPFPAA
jgi:hypothetical protein